MQTPRRGISPLDFSTQLRRIYITHGIDGYLDTDLAQAALHCLRIDRAKCRETALQYDWEKATDIFLSQLAIIQS